jgi:hypothetical protein
MPYATKYLHPRLAVVLCIAWSAQLARAQATEDDASTIAAARALAIEGVKLAESGRCDDAVDKLERAEALHHAPIVQAQLGDCYIRLGKLVAGTELLRNVLREPLPEKPSLALRKSYVRAQIALDAAKPKIARLTIRVHAGDAGYVNASVDGQPLPSALLGQERPTDPGEHVIEAAAPGYHAARSRVTLAPGQAQEVVLTLEAEPEPARADATPPAPDATEPAYPAPPVPALDAASARAGANASPTAPRHAAPDHTAAYVSWAVGAVALGLGAGFGIAAADAKSDLTSRCPNNACDPGARSDLDAARAQGTASTILFGTAAVAGVLGTVLFFLVDPNGTESNRAHVALGARGPNLAVAF